jgi:hypothetical protein
MKTFERICVKDYELTAANGDHFGIKQGEKVLTSDARDGVVTVFKSFWVPVPIELFAAEAQPFTS